MHGIVRSCGQLRDQTVSRVPKARVAVLVVLVCAEAIYGVAQALSNRVAIATEGEYRFVRSNGIPNHQTGRFPNRNNPNAISEKDYVFRVPTRPQLAAQSAPSGWAWFGVAVNGVPFEPGTQEFWNDDRGSGWTYEAIGGVSNLGIDENFAHVQPNGAYHYPGLPVGLVQQLGVDGQRMLLVGWAADGFPIYTGYGHADALDARSPLRKLTSSYRLRPGIRPEGPGGRYNGDFTQDFEYVKGLGDLDENNGRVSATPEYPQGIYCYFITETFPIISRSWRGFADASFQKLGPPPGAVPRRPRRPERGFPPRP